LISVGSLPNVFSRYVDIVFANADEAAEFTGDDDPKKGLEALGELCHISAVKFGADGASLKNGGRTVKVLAIIGLPVFSTDT
jgi:sugar/nucleoside kinase (ribokinase family)